MQEFYHQQFLRQLLASLRARCCRVIELMLEEVVDKFSVQFTRVSARDWRDVQAPVVRSFDWAVGF